MTPTEYHLEFSRLTKEIVSLEQKKRKLKFDYIEEHALFEKGDKVRITFRELDPQLGYVRARGVHDDGTLFYNFWKVKKDGSCSQHRLYIDDKITKIELFME